MRILALIPARGGSKGIPKKNIKLIAGKPLIEYTIDAAKKSRYIDSIVLSSDSEEILEYGEKNKIDILKRPDEFAADTSSMKDVIFHVLEDFRIKNGEIPEIVLLLQPTSPLRTEQHIDEALEIFLEDSKADSLVSIIETPHNHSPYSVMKFNENGYLDFFIDDGENYNLRQSKPKTFSRNGAALYIFKCDMFLKTGSIYGEKCVSYLMKEEESIDIDNMYDFKIAEFLLGQKYGK